MKTTELSDTLLNVDIEDKNDSSVELEFTQIEDTPFTIVKQGDKYFSVIGKHRITEDYLSKEICEAETTKLSWTRINQLIWIVLEKQEEFKKQLKQQENE